MKTLYGDPLVKSSLWYVSVVVVVLWLFPWTCETQSARYKGLRNHDVIYKLKREVKRHGNYNDREALVTAPRRPQKIDEMMKKMVQKEDALRKKSLKKEELMMYSINNGEELAEKRVKVEEELTKKNVKEQDKLTKKSVKKGDELIKKNIKKKEQSKEESVKEEEDLSKKKVKREVKTKSRRDVGNKTKSVRSISSEVMVELKKFLEHLEKAAGQEIKEIIVKTSFAHNQKGLPKLRETIVRSSKLSEPNRFFTELDDAEGQSLKAISLKTLFLPKNKTKSDEVLKEVIKQSETKKLPTVIDRVKGIQTSQTTEAVKNKTTKLSTIISKTASETTTLTTVAKSDGDIQRRPIF